MGSFFWFWFCRRGEVMIETTVVRRCCRCKKVMEQNVVDWSEGEMKVPSFEFKLDQRAASFDDLCEKCGARLHALMDQAMLVKE